MIFIHLDIIQYNTFITKYFPPVGILLLLTCLIFIINKEIGYILYIILLERKSLWSKKMINETANSFCVLVISIQYRFEQIEYLLYSYYNIS